MFSIPFYRDSISTPNRILTDVVTIPGDGFVNVGATWNGLTEGEHRIWVSYEYNNAGEQSFYTAFNVTGLADIRIDSAEITQPSVLNSGDEAQVSIQVRNAGSVDAPASSLGLNWGASVTETIPVPELFCARKYHHKPHIYTTINRRPHSTNHS